MPRRGRCSLLSTVYVGGLVGSALFAVACAATAPPSDNPLVDPSATPRSAATATPAATTSAAPDEAPPTRTRTFSAQLAEIFEVGRGTPKDLDQARALRASAPAP